MSMKPLLWMLLFLTNSVSAFVQVPVTDTIVPPPEFPEIITGSQYPCEGELSYYTCDIPIGCQANWFINSIPQSGQADTLEVVWWQPGSFEISMQLSCDTLLLQPLTLQVTVGPLPNPPTAISGEDSTCLSSTHTYSTQVNENETCQWKVNGIIQPTDSTFLSCTWTNSGIQEIEVRAINECGPGNPVFLYVQVDEWPVVFLGNDTTLFDGETLVLDAGNQGAGYLWSTGETTQTILVTNSGNYWVNVTNGCGETTDTIRVEVITGMNQNIAHPELEVTLSGDYLTAHVKRQTMLTLEVWDIQGRLISEFNPSEKYYIPQKGILIIRVTTREGMAFNRKVIKKSGSNY